MFTRTSFVITVSWIPLLEFATNAQSVLTMTSVRNVNPCLSMTILSWKSEQESKLPTKSSPLLRTNRAVWRLTGNPSTWKKGCNSFKDLLKILKKINKCKKEWKNLKQKSKRKSKKKLKKKSMLTLKRSWKEKKNFKNHWKKSTNNLKRKWDKKRKFKGNLKEKSRKRRKLPHYHTI